MASAGSIRAARAHVEIGADTTRFERALKAAEASLRRFGQRLRQIGTSIARAGAAITAPFAAALTIFARWGDTLDKMSQRTGISVEALSELEYAADLSGGKIENLDGAMRRLAASMLQAQQGAGEAADAFAMLGIDVNALAKLTPEQQLLTIAEALSRVTDQTLRAALAQAILGRAAYQLLPLLQLGAKGIEELRSAYREMGLTMSTDAATSAAELTNRIATLRKIMRAISVEIGSALTPGIIRLADKVIGASRGIIEFVRHNAALIRGIALTGSALIGVGTALVIAGTVIGSVATVLGVLASAVGFVLSPLGLLTIALGAGVVAFFKFSDAGKRAVAGIQNAFDLIKDIGRTLVDSIIHGDWATAWSIITDGFSAAWDLALAKLGVKWIELLGKLRIYTMKSINDTFGQVFDIVAETEKYIQNMPNEPFSRLTDATEAWQRFVEKIRNSEFVGPPEPLPVGNSSYTPFDVLDAAAKARPITRGTFDPEAVTRGFGETKAIKLMQDIKTGVTRIVNALSSGEPLVFQ